MKSGLFSRVHAPKRRKGFTLIEVVAVLVILAVFAAWAIERLPDSNPTLASERDLLASHLRYTQLRALADIRDWELRFLNATTYQIGSMDGANFTPVPIPGGNQTSRSFDGSVSVPSTPTVRFDSWGRPVDGGGAPLASDLSVNLTAAGSTQDVSIYAATGLIP